MLFAGAMNVLMVACFVMLYRAATRSDQPHRKLLFSVFLALLALCGFGFLAALVPGPIDRMNLSPAAFIVFGLVGAFLFVARAADIAHELRRGTVRGISFRLGGCILCVISALYVVFACVNHYWFFRGDRAGVASVAGLRIPNLLCEEELLVRLEEGGADYRCPRSFILGRNTRAPFAPDYVSAHSVELGRRLVELEAAADQ